ncbi:hypothetical protein [Bavariicoccus seileri]|uniref:hypothetical protein n=1 Tax=Bavariicoccus seileri TaxID=549685 RepID=UPI0003B2E21F|nr:hypothetical protein [Bavariicoccus seileri]
MSELELEYQRQIAILKRENQHLKIQLEQKKEKLSYCKKKVDKAKRILGRLFNDDDIDRWQKHLADETKEQCN